MSIQRILSGIRQACGNRRVRLLLWAIGAIPIGIMVLISLWSVSFGFPAGFVGLLVVGAGISLYAWRRLTIAVLLVPVVWTAANLALVTTTLDTYDKCRESYFAKVARNDELSFREKANVYGLHIIMALAAFPMYPEASREALGLHRRSAGGTRMWRSAFFLKSKRIRETLAGGTTDTMNVRWGIRDYALGKAEARFALALNPCRLTIRRTPAGTVYQATVRVEYPMSAEAVLIPKPMEVRVEEGLFGYLQRCGWLHPYDAVWIARQP